jgi:hypothetical protein
MCWGPQWAEKYSELGLRGVSAQKLKSMRSYRVCLVMSRLAVVMTAEIVDVADRKRE